MTAVREKLLASRTEGMAKKIDLLTLGLPPLENELAKLLEGRRLNYRRFSGSSAHGREVFAKSCALCHQIGGQGAVIGPQLDGIGERGMERLIEDVLDPNRNVDPHFKTTVYILKDGRVLSGLFRRQEGKKITIADSTGKELSFEESAVDQKQASPNSLMPSNVGTSMPETDFYDLLAYLLAQKDARRGHDQKMSPSRGGECGQFPFATRNGNITLIPRFQTMFLSEVILRFSFRISISSFGFLTANS